MAYAANVDITVNWPNYAEENRLTLRDSSGGVLGTFCHPTVCFSSDDGDRSHSETQSFDLNSGETYTLFFEDAYPDAWNGAGAGVTVVQTTDTSSGSNSQLFSGNHTTGASSTRTFTVESPPGPPPVTDCGTSNTSGFASSGVGAYKPLIFWLEWGCGGTTTFTSGGVYQKVWQIAPGVALEGTLTLTSGVMRPYVTGTWTGDMLDDLYTGPNPIGLGNITDGADYSFTLDYVLKINGVTVPSVIVTAPAEDLDSAPPIEEFHRLTTNGNPWELLEIPTGTHLDAVYSNANKTIELKDQAPEELNSTVILASENATQVIAEINPGGNEAIAFGVFLGLDYGDAPASYGTAAHYDILKPQGSSKPASYTDATTLTASTIVFDPIRLGTANTDGEDSANSSADATGDDTDGTDDEDGVSVPLSDFHSGLTSYDLTVVCGDSQTVVGWIDWEKDGSFTQASDQSASTTCSGGSATLSWTGIPALTSGNTFLRVRTSSSAGVTSPTSAVVSGEAEDYQITITPSSDLSVTKTSISGAYTPGGDDTYTIVVSNAGPDDVAGVVIADTLPSGVTLRAVWTCTASGTSSCSTASGGSVGGNTVSLTADIKNGETVTITVPVIYSTDPAAY